MLHQAYKVMGANPPVDPEHMLIDLVEWLLRLPARSPRRVHRSWTARTKILRPLEIQGLERVANCLEAGGNLLPFLGDASRTIRQRSREIPKTGSAVGNKRWQPDLLFLDWGIHHFHLGPDLEAKEEKVLRSARVLFAYLTEQDAYLLDVLSHTRTDGGIAWADKGLLETLSHEWPGVMDRFELRGALAPSALHEPTSTEIHELRRAGANSLVALNGKMYMGPGMGLATDRSSMRAVKLSSEIRCELHRMEQFFRDSADYAHAHLFVAADASVGYFIPSRNTAISYVPARTSDCRITWFFQRLLQEVPIFRGQPQGAVWLRPGVTQRKKPSIAE
jgi:hypothetical protein